MSYQFIHIEAYARVGSNQKGKEKKRGISEIIAEATREPSACPHVSTPVPPTHLYGVPVEEIEEIANDWASTQKDAKGRKLRADGLALLAGVVSVKRDDEDRWPSVRATTLEYLKNKYGERLRSVVEHTDEEHPHLHFYVVPLPGEKFDQVHEGRKASAVAKSEGKKKGEQNTAYIEAMRAFQDEFSETVGLANGMARIGPRKRRLSRAGWHQEKQHYKALADQKKIAEMGFKKGFKQGYAKGKKRALEEFEKFAQMGAKVGNWLASVMGSYHQPTKDTLRELEKTKERAKREKEKAQEQLKNAEKTITEKVEKQVNDLRKEVEKQKRIAENAEKDADRFQEETKQALAQVEYLTKKTQRIEPT